MTGIDVLRMQLQGSFNLLDERLRGTTDEEWSQRAFPGTSKLGFILWHCARIMDWTVNCAIEGRSEIADRDPWRREFAEEACYGAGISSQAADAIAESVSRASATAYFAEVRDAVSSWFAQQTAETLDAVPPMKANQSSERYRAPSVWAEVEDLDGLAVWQLLARPCISHIRVHVGEFGVLRGALRSNASSRA